MELPAVLAEALERDRVLAGHHEVEFSVVSRPTGTGPRNGPPRRHGTFDSPVEAVELARSLSGQDVTVLADGHGPYWYSAAPDEVNGELLEVVCRDKVLGPEAAARKHRRDQQRRLIEQLRSEQRFAEAVDAVRGSEDTSEAEQRLQQRPLSLSNDQARHLLINRHLRLLTRQGQRMVEAELDDAQQTHDDSDPD